MHSYGANKFKTALDMRRRIENWPAAWALRLRRKHPGLTLLRFRDGMNVVCRGATRDWDVVHELLFAGGYRFAFDYLRGIRGKKNVLDLGGNIGLFSLLAASQSPDLTIHAFEPGPPNFRLFEMNRLANPGVGDRIILHREAVAGEARQTKWFFDEANPGGSSLFATQGTSFDVKISAFADVVAAVTEPIALAKIDIEGAEFEILERTPATVWERIPAISLELHDDPGGKLTQPQFLERMRALGYDVREESVCSYFLTRR
jgi:FkbM family methyltransferase